MLTTAVIGPVSTDPIYTSTDNNVHYSLWYRLYFYWQYCPPQPLVLHVLMQLTYLLTILTTIVNGLACTDTIYMSIDNTVHHSLWYLLYFYWQYCPPQSLLVLHLLMQHRYLLTILTTTVTCPACTDSIYTSSDNTVHHCHWYYLCWLLLHLFCQYCPPQSLAVLTPLTLLLTILSTTATGTTGADYSYTSSDNTVHRSLWLY